MIWAVLNEPSLSSTGAREEKNGSAHAIPGTARLDAESSRNANRRLDLKAQAALTMPNERIRRLGKVR